MATQITSGQAAAFVAAQLRLGKVAGVFDNNTIHQGIQVVCSEFNLQTLYTKQKNTITVAATVADVVGLDADELDGFEPHRFRMAWVTAKAPIHRINLEELLTLQQNKPRNGCPEKIAFSESTEAMVWPTPDADYEINLLWSPPFTSWTLPTPLALPTEETPSPVDDASQDGHALNLPPDVTKVICATGVPAHLMQFSPEHAEFVGTCRNSYQAFVEQMEGKNTFSAVSEQERRR